jgi:hypothetical protein
VTSLGWLIMTVSISSVIAMTVFCLWRVLTLPPVEATDLHAPSTIEPPDLKNID